MRNRRKDGSTWYLLPVTWYCVPVSLGVPRHLGDAFHLWVFGTESNPRCTWSDGKIIGVGRWNKKTVWRDNRTTYWLRSFLSEIFPHHNFHTFFVHLFHLPDVPVFFPQIRKWNLFIMIKLEVESILPCFFRFFWRIWQIVTERLCISLDSHPLLFQNLGDSGKKLSKKNGPFS